MTSSLQFVAADFLDSEVELPTPARPATLPVAFIGRLVAEDNPLQALLMLLHQLHPGRRWSHEAVRVLLSRTLLELDTLLNLQLNSILHHPQLQALEANWRGICLLTEQSQHSDHERQVRIKVLNLSWTALCQDLQRAIEFDQSALFHKIHADEFGSAGGEPFGLLLGAYEISHHHPGGQADISCLQELCRIAAAAFSPLVVNASPALFGVDEFSQLAGVSHLASHFSSPEMQSWRSLRAQEDSRFLAMALPRMLMRGQLSEHSNHGLPFNFSEARTDQHALLWGPACFGVGCVAIRAFCESGWFAQIRSYRQGHISLGVIDNMPDLHPLTGLAHTYPLHSAVDWQISDSMEKQLTDAGFLSLQALPNTRMLVMSAAPSVQLSANYTDPAAQMSARLASMLHYTLCVSRFAHYLKVMGRDRIGGYRTPQECEAQLQRWLHGYTMASAGSSDEMRARFPLRDARVTVRDIAGAPGRFYSVIHLQPHFQLDQMITSVRLVTELAPIHD